MSPSNIFPVKFWKILATVYLLGEVVMTQNY